VLEELKNTSPPPQEVRDNDVILKAAVDWTIKEKSNNSIPGTDGILAELIKTGGEKFAELFHQLCVSIWREEIIPKEWWTRTPSDHLSSGSEF